MATSSQNGDWFARQQVFYELVVSAASRKTNFSIQIDYMMIRK